MISAVARDDHQGAGLGGGRRLSAGQLQLPQLRRLCAAACRALRRARNRRWPSAATAGRWVLLNASPDLRQQIAATPELAPRAEAAARSSPIEAVVLTNGDVDHVAGLLSLREGFAFTLYASARVLAALAANSIFNVLDAQRRAAHRPAARPRRCELAGGLIDRGLRGARQGRALPRGGEPAGLRHARGRHARPQGDRPGSGASAFYIPGCAAVDARARRAAARRARWSCSTARSTLTTR